MLRMGAEGDDIDFKASNMNMGNPSRVQHQACEIVIYDSPPAVTLPSSRRTDVSSHAV